MYLTPEKRSGHELMDLPTEAYGADELEGTLADIRIINRYLGDRCALLKHLSRLTRGASSLSVLDIATGSADLPIAVVEWARKGRIGIGVTAVDINRETVEIARRETASYPEITVEVADGLRLPYPDRSFDIVICSKTAHHLSNDDVARLIREMSRLSRRGYLLMDLRRSWIAYALIILLTRIFTSNRLTRNDGPLSVLKSFTAAELRVAARQAGASRFTIAREPFWLLVLRGEVA